MASTESNATSPRRTLTAVRNTTARADIDSSCAMAASRCAGLAERRAVEVGDLVRTDHPGLGMRRGDGLGLGARQAQGEGGGGFARGRGFVDFGPHDVEGQPQAAQQLAPVGRGGGEDQLHSGQRRAGALDAGPAGLRCGRGRRRSRRARSAAPPARPSAPCCWSHSRWRSISRRASLDRVVVVAGHRLDFGPGDAQAGFQGVGGVQQLRHGPLAAPAGLAPHQDNEQGRGDHRGDEDQEGGGHAGFRGQSARSLPSDSLPYQAVRSRPV